MTYRLLWRGAALTIAASGVGALAGIWRLPLAMRGAALFGILALSVLVLDWWARRELDVDLPPASYRVWTVAILAGLIAAGVVSLLQYSTALNVRELDIPPTALGWPTFLLCQVYALGLHWAYHSRWREGRFVFSWAALLTLVFILAAMLRFLLMGIDKLEIGWPDLSNIGSLGSMMVYCAMFGVPMALAWLAILGLFDPAANRARWHYTRGEP